MAKRSRQTHNPAFQTRVAQSAISSGFGCLPEHLVDRGLAEPGFSCQCPDEVIVTVPFRPAGPGIRDAAPRRRDGGPDGIQQPGFPQGRLAGWTSLRRAFTPGG
jgi:hypothetical protein